ncbi:hypothetical protein AN641_08335 [Candidatus Epulonipiscioides gigas]|nr:hypothetical protein AN641_08335 [Epulopiscium sp. SCG-C07WGA-EpuloA2]
MYYLKTYKDLLKEILQKCNLTKVITDENILELYEQEDFKVIYSILRHSAESQVMLAGLCLGMYGVTKDIKFLVSISMGLKSQITDELLVYTLKIINNIFSEDVILKGITLDTLMQLYPNKQIIFELIKIIESKMLPLDLVLVFEFDIRRVLFTNSNIEIENYYIKFQNLHTNIMEQIKQKIKLKIPNNYEPNKDCVVITTSQLLIHGHSISNIIYDLYNKLKYNLNKDIYIIVCLYNTTKVESKYGELRNSRINYNSQWDGEFKYFKEWPKPWNGITGTTFQGFQIHLDNNVKLNIKKVYNYILNLKPSLIIDCANSWIGELFSDFIKVVSMNFGEDIPPTTAKYILKYHKTKNQQVLLNREIANQLGKTIFDINYMDKYSNKEHITPKYLVTKEEKGLPNNSFTLGLVGNRLNFELDEYFLGLLEEIIKEFNYVYVVSIGNFTNETLLDKFPNLKEKIINLGYSSNLLEDSQILDLFINPKRMGGAGGLNSAMFAGAIPITLAEGDVGAFVPSYFIADNLEEYPIIIRKYIEDKDYFEEMKLKLNNYIEKLYLSPDDRIKEIKDLFYKIEQAE